MKMALEILKIEGQKSVPLLGVQLHQKSKLSKYNNDKSCSHSFYILKWKKHWEGFGWFFDIENWLWKSEFCCFRPSILKRSKG